MFDPCSKLFGPWDKLFCRGYGKYPAIIRRRHPVRPAGEESLCPGISRGFYDIEEIFAIAREDSTLAVTPERTFSLLTENTALATGILPWRNENQLTGRGITCGFLETGIHPHPQFKHRIRFFADLVSGRPRPYDDHGHGTHVAGIFCGEPDPSRGFHPMAPEADLAMLKVLSSRGLSPESRVLRGLQLLFQRRQELNLRLLSLSLGSTPIEPLGADPLIHMLSRFYRAGITVFAAAGNGGPVTSPAIAPFVVAVGATHNPGGAPVPAPFTSRSMGPLGQPKPDIWAPGTGILSLTVPRHFPAENGCFCRKTGTSMACPVVAGGAALLLEAEPDLSPRELRTRLLTCTRPLPGGERFLSFQQEENEEQ